MGGHGHGHGHHEPYVVPKPEVYNNVKIESIKELKSLQEQLAKHGLKDPWIRFVDHNWPLFDIYFLYLQLMTFLIFSEMKFGDTMKKFGVAKVSV